MTLYKKLEYLNKIVFCGTNILYPLDMDNTFPANVSIKKLFEDNKNNLLKYVIDGIRRNNLFSDDKTENVEEKVLSKTNEINKNFDNYMDKTKISLLENPQKELLKIAIECGLSESQYNPILDCVNNDTKLYSVESDYILSGDCYDKYYIIENNDDKVLIVYAIVD